MLAASKARGRRTHWWLSLIILVGLGAGPALAQVRSAWVIPEVVNVRKGPGPNHDRVAQTTRGTKVFVSKFNSGWCYVKLPNETWGWIREDLLQFSASKGRELAEAASTSATRTTTQTNPPVWVSVDKANVRSGPGLGHGRYGTLDRGTKCYVVERKGEWLYCRTPGGFGWMNVSVVTFDLEQGRRLAAQAPQPDKAFINAGVVNLRRGPGTSYEIVAKLRQGQTVWLLDTQNDWSKVRVEGGNAGWVSTALLKLPETSTTSAPAPAPAAPPNFPQPTTSRFRELTAWVDEDVVNVRESPGTDSPVKFQLRKHEKVTVTALQGHWCKLRTEAGDWGWAAGWVLDFAPPGQSFSAQEGDRTVEPKVGWIARPTVNLRSGPGENYPRVGSLSLSTPVVIVGQKDDWFKVAMDNQEIGWVASWLTDTRGQRLARQGSAGLEESSPDSSGASPAEMSAPPDGGTGLGSQIIRTARQFLGNRYVRGGASPGGFDCSGLVSYVLGQFGISASRTTTGLFRQGRPVSRENLSPGDVVFFENTYRSGISHVGFYLGGNLFIHASNPTGGVKITPLDTGYYASRYIGARRMH